MRKNGNTEQPKQMTPFLFLFFPLILFSSVSKSDCVSHNSFKFILCLFLILNKTLKLYCCSSCLTWILDGLQEAKAYLAAGRVGRSPEEGSSLQPNETGLPVSRPGCVQINMSSWHPNEHPSLSHRHWNLTKGNISLYLVFIYNIFIIHGLNPC